MVSAVAAQVVIGLGILVSAVSVIISVLFIQADDFVLADRACNTSDPEGVGAAGAAFCNADNLAVDANGDVCQVGNLGLNTASFTPECLVGTPYEIPPLITPGESSPTEFAALFPAQTGFGGAVTTITGMENNFENCDQYFAPTNLLLQGVIAGATAGATNGTLDAFRTSVKESYDQGILDNFALLDAFFINGPAQTANGFLAQQMPPTSLDEIFNASMRDLNTFITALNNLVAATDAATFGGGDVGTELDADFDAALSGVAGFAGFALGNGFMVDTTVVDLVQRLIALGVPAADVEGGILGGISDNGIWTVFGSSLICQMNPTCTYIELLQNARDDAFAALAAAPGLAMVESFITQAGQLDVLVGAVATFEAQFREGFIETAAGLGIPDPFGMAGTRETIELIVATSLETDTMIPVPGGLAGFAPLVGIIGANIVEVCQFIVSQGLSRASFIAALQGGLREVDAIPQNISTPVVLENPSYALVCAGATLATTCTFQELVATLSAGAALQAMDPTLMGVDLLIAQGTAEALAAVDRIFNTVCAAVPTLDACLVTVGQSGTPVEDGGTQSYFDAGAIGLLGAFYDVEDEESLLELLPSLVDQCKDDELDKAAIEQAQQFVPAGTGLIAIGLVVGIVNLLVKTRATKIVGVVAGAVALLGTVLIIIALVGVLMAPVYQAVTEEVEAVEDGTNAFKTGPAQQLAFGTIIAGALGSILLCVGGALSKAPEDGGEVMGKAL